MTCQYQSQPPGKDTGRRFCAIGLYGGNPYIGNCKNCIERGENTPEFAADLLARSATTHPAAASRVSGCCDSAQNYHDRI
jgi:hypothetical protein